MTLFRGCRYEVVTYTPNKRLWSRHSSLKSAQRSFREAVNNRRGDHAPGTRIELVDRHDGMIDILGREVARS